MSLCDRLTIPERPIIVDMHSKKPYGVGFFANLAIGWRILIIYILSPSLLFRMTSNLPTPYLKLFMIVPCEE